MVFGFGEGFLGWWGVTVVGVTVVGELRHIGQIGNMG